MRPIIVYLRQDLRLEDNPALHAAAQLQLPVLPVYIFDTVHPGPWQIGSAQKWWLHQSLAALQSSFSAQGISLIIQKGDPLSLLPEIVAKTHALSVYWNRCYEPYAIERDTQLKTLLKELGVEAGSFNGSLLIEPWEVQNKSGSYYRVFTHFWNHCLKTIDPALPLAAPLLRPFSSSVESLSIESLDLLPKKYDWTTGIRNTWTPGERGAEQNLQLFLENSIKSYKHGRDFPAETHTSRLSPYLHFGEISPRQIWHSVQPYLQGVDNEQAAWFLRELGWREFSYHLLYHYPKLPEEPFLPQFCTFQWKTESADLTKWQKGLTGYPIVDAGMRELWHTGWMHNRVRMIAASFLTKDLLIHWKRGEEWFWDTLVDADLANNAASWQWVAGCGADAAPYFRIFNPVLQGQKFDPKGDYIKRWIPELQHLEGPAIHAPWTASPLELRQSGVILGKDYPYPLVDHQEARKEALRLYN